MQISGLLIEIPEQIDLWREQGEGDHQGALRLRLRLRSECLKRELPELQPEQC